MIIRYLLNRYKRYKYSKLISKVALKYFNYASDELWIYSSSHTSDSWYFYGGKLADEFVFGGSPQPISNISDLLVGMTEDFLQGEY